MSSDTLLHLVARGCTIITELSRLIELIPSPFKRDCLDVVQYECTYDTMICDFSYFKNIETFETIIDADKSLKAADEKLCDQYGELIKRFYFAFESIQRYATELNQFVSDLDADLLVGHSLDSLLADTECRQLLCEVHFILGYLMLSVDNNFEGGLRERLIVSFYRYSSYKSSPDSHLDATCNLMRTTGFRSPQQQLYRSTKPLAGQHRPKGYPETYFDRLGVNKTVVNLLIAKLQTHDIYNQTQLAYPHPEHRSIALSQQASILYVLLYFCPTILSNQRSRMREITDKFFYDSWVLNVYLGDFESVIEAWQPYKAARESIGQLYDVESVRSLASRQNILLNQVSRKLSYYLAEGWLQNDQNVLEKHKQILDEIRNANYLLKWHLLQSQMKTSWHLELSKKISSIVSESYAGKSNLCELLQNLAQLELGFSHTYDRLLETRLARIEGHKSKAIDLLDELIEIYTDSKATRWTQTNAKLASVLASIRQQVAAISDESPGSNLVVCLIKQLETAQETHNDGRSLQVVQLFKSTNESLLDILRCLGLSQSVRLALSSVREIGYAWRLLETNFVPQLQAKIMENPLLVLRIESTFVKLSTAFESHLMRLHQADAQADLISITQYYSTKLVSYIQLVLHVIPEKILTLVKQISQLKNSSGCCLAAKLEVSQLKDHMQPARRLKMLELSHWICYYARSMIRMRDTNIGLIKLNARQLLESGIKRELSKQLQLCIQEAFDSPIAKSQANLEPAKAAQRLELTLATVEQNLRRHREAFESIRDYLGIKDAHIWRHELAHLVQTHVLQAEQLINDEFSSFLLDNDGSYSQHDGQSTTARSKLSSSTKTTTAIGPSRLSSQSNFMVSILELVLQASKPNCTNYEEQTGAWYDSFQHAKVLDVHPFELLAASLTPLGLSGFDQLCCSLLELELGKLTASVQLILEHQRSTSGALIKIVELSCRYGEAATCWAREAKLLHLSARKDLCESLNGQMLDHLLSVGQLQALRLTIGLVQASKCRYEARNLFACVETLNGSLLGTYRKHLLNQHQQQKEELAAADKQMASSEKFSCTELACDDLTKVSEHESGCLAKLANWLDSVGLSDPLSKVYLYQQQCNMTTNQHWRRDDDDGDQSALVYELALLVLVEQCNKLHYSASLCGLIGRQRHQHQERGRRKSLSYYVTIDSSKQRDCTANPDAQCLLYGLWTLLYHLHPTLHHTTGLAGGPWGQPLGRLLHRLGEHVRCTLLAANLQQAGSSSRQSSQELPSELASLLLAAAELTRLSRQATESLVGTTCLEPYLLDSLPLHVAKKAH